ncbi:hypothetical protein TNCV_4548351 [Trichonephila clavipes]|nr:hypothetical protein TNCV_4548351 [Trichonephila clavipes]
MEKGTCCPRPMVQTRVIDNRKQIRVGDSLTGVQMAIPRKEENFNIIFVGSLDIPRLLYGGKAAVTGSIRAATD